MKNVTGWSRDEIAANVARDLPNRSYVNLGIGIPELVALHLPLDKSIMFHTENGLLGMVPIPERESSDPDLINAGKRHVSALHGASYFHHADSFTMIRGGHIDVSVLGGLQVSAKGDLANWSTAARSEIPAVGGAMDLVAGAGMVLVAMSHTARDDVAKIVETCSYPITGSRVVSRVYTDLATISVSERGLEVVEMGPGVDFEYLQARTAAPLLLDRA